MEAKEPLGVKVVGVFEVEGLRKREGIAEALERRDWCWGTLVETFGMSGRDATSILSLRTSPSLPEFTCVYSSSTAGGVEAVAREEGGKG